MNRLNRHVLPTLVLLSTCVSLTVAAQQLAPAATSTAPAPSDPASSSSVPAPAVSPGSNSTATAAPPTSGVWTGILEKQGDKQLYPAEVTLQSKKLSLHLGGAIACRIPATYTITDASGARYSFGPSTNGGKACDDMYPGEIVVRAADEKTIAISIGRTSTVWAGRLSLDSTSP